jgi:hypothetical protein
MSHVDNSACEARGGPLLYRAATRCLHRRFTLCSSYETLPRRIDSPRRAFRPAEVAPDRGHDLDRTYNAAPAKK